jgi:diadenosine tetraphosphate (Ap4A) HIT family hydrolase
MSMSESAREDCTLCKATLKPIIAESIYWKLVLNWNQRFLGACFLTLKRHIESITELTCEEWAELHEEIKKSTNALNQSFAPDHFNYVFLQNQDRHVHMHILPRYAKPRTFVGEQFDDPDYPSHYTIPGHNHHLTEKRYNWIASQIDLGYRNIDATRIPPVEWN